MPKGQTFRVKTVSGNEVTVEMGGSERRYLLNPFARGHEGHGPVQAGDVLVAVSDSTPGDSTLVTAPCGCRVLLRPP
jgi:hypothetical protein